MSKFLYRTIVAAILATLSPMAYSDDEGFYVGTGLGDFAIDEGSFDGSDFGYKVFGGWMYNRNVGLEIEFIDGGTVEDGGLGVDSTGINPSLKGVWPINEQFDVFGKIGHYFWDADFEIDGNRVDSETGSAFSYTLGGGFNFTDSLGVTLEYQWLQIEDADATFLSGSVIWKF